MNEFQFRVSFSLSWLVSLGLGIRITCSDPGRVFWISDISELEKMVPYRYGLVLVGSGSDPVTSEVTKQLTASVRF